MEDNQFWNKHYAQFREQEPSPFCRFCIDHVLRPSDTVVEIGCGNGRDGLALSRVVTSYLGLDTCPTAVKNFTDALSARGGVGQKASVQLGNGASFDLAGLEASERLVLFSRFSLHSIDRADEARLFDNLAALGDRDWICALEVRTIYDELYGVGERVGEHEFKTDHYRRFIDPKAFVSRIGSAFHLRYYEVARGFAPYKTEDPLVLRAVFGGRPA